MGKVLHLKRNLTMACFALLGASNVWADDAALKTLYETAFATDPSSEWTTVDKSTKAGTTWKWGANNFSYGAALNYAYGPAVKIMHDYDALDDDYYISPAMELKAGTKYTVTTATGKNAANQAKLTLEIGTSLDDMSTYKEVKTLNPAEDYANREETMEVTVEKDGTYYFAYHATQTEDHSDYLYILGLKVEAPDNGGSTVDPGKPTEDNVLNADFSTEPKDWAIVDKSSDDSNTWNWNANAFYDNLTYKYFPAMRILQSQYTTAQNDYLISPDMQLKKGVKYKVTTASAKQNDSAVLTLELGNSRTDVSGYKVIGTLTPSENYTDDRFQDFEFSVKEDGTYNLAYHVKEETNGKQKTFVFGMKVVAAGKSTTDPTDPTEPDDPQKVGDVVYSSDLTEDGAADKLTVVDANKDNATWAVTDGIEGLTYNSDDATSAADDWVVTPAVKIQKGMNYSISAKFNQRGAFDPDKIEVYVGDEPAVDKLTTLVASYDVNEGTTDNLARYIGKEDGKKYIGFRLVSENAQNGQLSLLGINVKAIEAATPNPVENLKAESDSEAKTVKLTWTNPSKDTDGYGIVEKVGAKVYENDILVKTIDELSGAESELVYTPQEFSGETTYKIVAFIGEKESTAATVTVNLDDRKGDEYLVKAFKVSNSTKNEWTIIDGGGKGVWKYDYSDIFDFNYQRGGATEDDWLISPEVKLSAADRYVLKYKLKTARDFAASVELTIGEGTTAADQKQVVASHINIKQNGFGDFKTQQFSVPEDGNYNIAFHVTQADYYVDVRGLEIYSIGEPTGIGEVKGKIGVVAYNAASGSLLVPAGSKVCVYAANGAAVMHATSGTDALNLQSLANGVYVVKVTDADGKSTSLKLVK